jgi:hypothetical protein
MFMCFYVICTHAHMTGQTGTCNYGYEVPHDEVKKIFGPGAQATVWETVQAIQSIVPEYVYGDGYCFYACMWEASSKLKARFQGPKKVYEAVQAERHKIFNEQWMHPEGTDADMVDVLLAQGLFELSVIAYTPRHTDGVCLRANPDGKLETVRIFWSRRWGLPDEEGQFVPSEYFYDPVGPLLRDMLEGKDIVRQAEHDVILQANHCSLVKLLDVMHASREEGCSSVSEFVKKQTLINKAIEAERLKPQSMEWEKVRPKHQNKRSRSNTDQAGIVQKEIQEDKSSKRSRSQKVSANMFKPLSGLADAGADSEDSDERPLLSGIVDDIDDIPITSRRFIDQAKADVAKRKTSQDEADVAKRKTNSLELKAKAKSKGQAAIADKVNERRAAEGHAAIAQSSNRPGSSKKTDSRQRHEDSDDKEDGKFTVKVNKNGIEPRDKCTLRSAAPAHG